MPVIDEIESQLFVRCLLGELIGCGVATLLVLRAGTLNGLTIDKDLAVGEVVLSGPSIVGSETDDASQEAVCRAGRGNRSGIGDVVLVVRTAGSSGVAHNESGIVSLQALRATVLIQKCQVH